MSQILFQNSVVEDYDLNNNFTEKEEVYKTFINKVAVISFFPLSLSVPQEIQAADFIFESNKNKFEVLYDQNKSSVGEEEYLSYVDFSFFTKPEYYIKNILLLRSELKIELKRQKKALNRLDLIQKFFYEDSLKISEINFKKLSLELTASETIKYTLVLDSKPEKLLIITRPLCELEDVTGNQIIFSFFVDRQFVAGTPINLDDLVNGIKSYLASE